MSPLPDYLLPVIDQMRLCAAGLDSPPELPLMGRVMHLSLPRDRFFVWVHSFERNGKKQPPDLIVAQQDVWIEGECVADSKEIFDSRKGTGDRAALCKWFFETLETLDL